MERMTVLQPFTEYVDGKKAFRAKGDEISVTAETAERHRAAGLARSKPAPRAKAEPSSDENPDTTDRS